MLPYMYLIPVAVFLLTAVLSGGIINLKDPRVVRRPGGMWTPARIFRDEEWTPHGLAVRRRLLRSMALALGAGILAWAAVLAITRAG